MPTPDDLEREHTLTTAVVRYNELRGRGGPVPAMTPRRRATHQDARSSRQDCGRGSCRLLLGRWFRRAAPAPETQSRPRLGSSLSASSRSNTALMLSLDLQSQVALSQFGLQPLVAARQSIKLPLLWTAGHRPRLPAKSLPGRPRHEPGATPPGRGVRPLPARTLPISRGVIGSSSHRGLAVVLFTRRTCRRPPQSQAARIAGPRHRDDYAAKCSVTSLFSRRSIGRRALDTVHAVRVRLGTGSAHLAAHHPAESGSLPRLGQW